LVVVEAVDELKSKAIRRLDMQFGSPVDEAVFRGVDGVHDVTADGTRVSVSFKGEIATLLRAAMAHDLVNLNSDEADLEEIFLNYYRDPESEKASV
jgi:ABC-2 type transport system ATP-binding protein